MPSLADHMAVAATLPRDGTAGALAGRVWLPAVEGPAVVAVRADGLYDISQLAPTMRDLSEAAEPARILQRGERRAPWRANGNPRQHARGNARPAPALAVGPHRSAALKAAGVTFPRSMLERVIEEQARGAPEKAEAIRKSVAAQLRRQPGQSRSRQQSGRRTQARADRRGRLVAIPRSRDRPGRRDLHQGAADVGGRPRHGCGPAPDLDLE